MSPYLATLLALLTLFPPPKSTRTVAADDRTANDLTVAAASDLQAAFPAVAAQFEKETGHHVAITFGSSGNFFAQIQNGAPFDLFFSADIDYARRLESASLAEPGSFYEYAVGKIVLWTRKDSGIDLTAGPKVLVDRHVRKIAIANPEHAPYGRAAVASLEHEGLYDAVRSKIVLGENISQTAQFVQSGNADVGIIALSLAAAPQTKEIGTYIEMPSGSYPPIEQAAVIVKASNNKARARDFLTFLKKPATIRLMQSFGFEVPAPAAGPAAVAPAPPPAPVARAAGPAAAARTEPAAPASPPAPAAGTAAPLAPPAPASH